MYEELVRKDLTGLIFGNMRVRREYHSEPYNHLVDECECDCGNIFKTNRHAILRKGVISCPVCAAQRRGKEKRKDLVGQKFTRLLVQEYYGSGKDGRALWLCLCDCGKTTIVSGKYLLNGNTKSCGCLNKEIVRHGNGYRDLTGERFKNSTVLYQIESTRQGSRWHCLCDCGVEFDASGKSLRSGQVSDCGKHVVQKLSAMFREDLSGQKFYHLTVLSPATNQGGKTMWHYVCDCGRTGISSSTNLKSGKTRSCGKCIHYSYGEDRIEKYLLNHNIQFVRQKRFIGCKDRADLKFDFYIGSANLAVEYDGVMHYEETSIGNDLTGQRRRDKIKDKYCKDNDIRLLRIPYWQYEEIEEILSEWLFIDNTEDIISESA